MATFRSIQTPVANHGKIYASGRVAFGAALLLIIVIRLLFGFPDASGPRGWLGILGYGSLFATSLAALTSAWQGFVVWLARPFEGDIPGTLAGGSATVQEILHHRRIPQTYTPRRDVISLLIMKYDPRLGMLAPSDRQIVQNLAAPIVVLIAAITVGFFVVGFKAVLLLLPAGLSLGARFLALSVIARSEVTTGAVTEQQQHLGDKGDPLALYQHVVRVTEQYRVHDHQHRVFYADSPAIADVNLNAKVHGRYSIETQPQSMPESTEKKMPAMILCSAAILLGCTGWSCFLFQHVGSFPAPTTMATISGCGLASLIFSRSLWTSLYGYCFSYRFRSELFWVEFTGTCNTTRVGSQLQRTAYQTDLQLHVYSTRIISESSASLRSDASQGVSFFAPDIDEILKSPRLVLTTQFDESLNARTNSILGEILRFQDTADSARPTNLQSPEFQQHLLKLQLESMAQVHGRNLASQGIGFNLSPSQNPALLGPPENAQGTNRNLSIKPSVNVKPPSSLPPTLPSTPQKRKLPPPPPKRDK